MSVIKVGNNNFESVKMADKPVLLDFYADWCGPCRLVATVVAEIAKENPEYFIGKINVDEERELAQSFQIFSIPTLVVMKEGKEISRAVGAKSKEQILSMLEARG